MKPVILVFSSNEGGKVNLRPQYSDAILYHGGIPLVVPMNLCGDDLAQLCTVADGFMFSGGVDVNPSFYGEEALNSTVEVDETRDRLECAAVAQAIKSGKPIFGICRGIQAVNVFTGGSLYQDIASQIQTTTAHSQKETATLMTHTVNIEPGTLLHEIVGSDKIRTNSFHHQCVKTPAGNLQICARAEDGVIEALEDKTHPFLLLVQWHPEYTFNTDETSAKLFAAFIAAAKK